MFLMFFKLIPGSPFQDCRIPQFVDPWFGIIFGESNNLTLAMFLCKFSFHKIYWLDVISCFALWIENPISKWNKEVLRVNNPPRLRRKSLPMKMKRQKISKEKAYSLITKAQACLRAKTFAFENGSNIAVLIFSLKQYFKLRRQKAPRFTSWQANKVASYEKSR